MSNQATSDEHHKDGLGNSPIAKALFSHFVKWSDGDNKEVTGQSEVRSDNKDDIITYPDSDGEVMGCGG